MNKKIIALDVGDSWIGFAATDNAQLFVHPKEAVKSSEIIKFLEKYFLENLVEAIILGLPITLKGNESEQTKKVLNFKKILEEKFKDKNFFFQDERLSSQFAGKILRENKKSKSSEHSVAACIILENFLLKNKKINE